MTTSLGAVRREVKPMVALAVPVVVVELGWIAMGIVDIGMVGPLGAKAIGAVGVGSIFFLTLAVFGIGFLLGLDTLVSQAFGAEKLEDCHRWLVHGAVLSVVLAMPMTLLTRMGAASLHVWGFDPEVLRLTVPYLEVVAWSTLPLLLYATFRRYLQSMSVVLPVMFALVSANLINVLANWILIFGHLGAPALGVNGAGWATCISRVYMATVLLATILYRNARDRSGLWSVPRKLDLARMRRLVGLGFPAAIQVTLEVGVFAAVTALAGRLAPSALAAHQVALNVASVTFMVPLRRLGGSRQGGSGCGPTGRCRRESGRLGGTTVGCAVHGLRRAGVSGPSGADPPIVHVRASGGRDGGVTAIDRRLLPAVRRGAGRGDRLAARPGGHTHADDLEPRRTLVSRPPDGVRALFRRGLGRYRSLDRAVGRSDPGGAGASRDLGAAGS